MPLHCVLLWLSCLRRWSVGSLVQATGVRSPDQDLIYFYDFRWLIILLLEINNLIFGDSWRIKLIADSRQICLLIGNDSQNFYWLERFPTIRQICIHRHSRRITITIYECQKSRPCRRVNLNNLQKSQHSIFMSNLQICVLWYLPNPNLIPSLLIARGPHHWLSPVAGVKRSLRTMMTVIANDDHDLTFFVLVVDIGAAENQIQYNVEIIFAVGVRQSFKDTGQSGSALKLMRMLTTPRWPANHWRWPCNLSGVGPNLSDHLSWSIGHYLLCLTQMMIAELATFASLVIATLTIHTGW